MQANVVCHQLGFSNGATSASCCSPHGQVPTSFSYDDVRCAGTESTLDSCPHQNTHNCGSFEGAGVVCNTGSSTAGIFDFCLHYKCKIKICVPFFIKNIDHNVKHRSCKFK